MIIDHTGAMFKFTPICFRYIGRIAFPLYAFCVSQGCKHTKNIKKYLLRLVILAIFSEIPFDIAFNDKISLIYDLNTVFTLFLGVLNIYVYKINSKYNNDKLITFCSLITFSIISIVLKSDYSYFGIILIFCFYISDTKFKQILFFILLCILKFYVVFIAIICNIFKVNTPFIVYFSTNNLFIVLFTMLSSFFIYYYNNKRGKNIKWLFYVSYPLHIILLIIVKYFFKII